MSSIAILGTGRVGKALAIKLASAGHIIVVGTRDPAQAAAKWPGPKVTFTNPAEAVERTPVIFNATPGESSLERLTALREDLRGKILVDLSNAAARDSQGLPSGLMYAEKSLAEHLQEQLPETAVVKTLNTMLFSVMVNPRAVSTPATVFLSGNDTEAKARVRGLLSDLGWQASSVEDLGDISTARGPEAFMLFVPHIIRNHGFTPFALSLAR